MRLYTCTCSSFSQQYPHTHSLPPSPKLHLERNVIELGTLVADHQIFTTSFRLSNRGSRTGSFFIDVSPLPSWISLQPVNGHLEPDENTDIEVLSATFPSSFITITRTYMYIVLLNLSTLFYMYMYMYMYM